MSRLGEYGPVEMQGDLEALDDIAGVEVTIDRVRFAEGKFGEFAIMTCFDAERRGHEVGTSAMFVLQALHNVVDRKALPVQATFTRRGRTWVFE